MAGGGSHGNASDPCDRAGLPATERAGDRRERHRDADRDRPRTVGDARAVEGIDATVVAFHLPEPTTLVESPYTPPLHPD